MSGQKVCSVRDNEFSTEIPGRKCGKPATGRRTSGGYYVAVCDQHATGRALYQLGSRLYGCDEPARLLGLCLCPDDCSCHYPWRPTLCGCKAHAVEVSA